jgi:hypothetical protein
VVDSDINTNNNNNFHHGPLQKSVQKHEKERFGFAKIAKSELSLTLSSTFFVIKDAETTRRWIVEELSLFVLIFWNPTRVAPTLYSLSHTTSGHLYRFFTLCGIDINGRIVEIQTDRYRHRRLGSYTAQFPPAWCAPLDDSTVESRRAPDSIMWILNVAFSVQAKFSFVCVQSRSACHYTLGQSDDFRNLSSPSSFGTLWHTRHIATFCSQLAWMHVDCCFVLALKEIITALYNIE